MASDPSPPPSVSLPASKSLRPDEEDNQGSSVRAPPPAGFIFMCSSATKPDCFRHRVLGLPRGRVDAVSRIKRGAALFLYDFNTKHLHGPYRAESDGGLDLVPYAFHGRFPSQVKFEIEGDFMPLHESTLRNAIKENYFKGKFSPELNSTQVEKLRELFEPIAAIPPESALPRYIDDKHPAPTSYLFPSASHPAQPATYEHHPTSYVHPPSAHLVPLESYAPPYSYLAPPNAQPTRNTDYVTTAGYSYQAGYEAYGPLSSIYQYVQVPPSRSLYTQYSTSEHVLAPVYSTGPYSTAHNDPYQPGNVTSHYQQSTYESAAHGAEHGTVEMNLQLVRYYGSTPSGVTGCISEIDVSQQAVSYTTHGAISGVLGGRSVTNAAPATSYTDAILASSYNISPVIALPPQSVYVAAAAPANQ